MYKKWWDTPVCWLCDYGWILLLALALLLTAWFARSYWLPILGVAPETTVTPTVAAATITPTSDLYGYVNGDGGYAFNYPSQWIGNAAGADSYFQLPNNSKLEVIVSALQDGETLESLVDDTGPLTIPQSNLINLMVGGESAIQYDVLDESSQIIARTYRVLHAGRVYDLSLFAPLETGTGSFAQSLQQFDQLLLDFQFLP